MRDILPISIIALSLRLQKAILVLLSTHAPIFNDCHFTETAGTCVYTLDFFKCPLIAPSLRIQETMIIAEMSFNIQWLHPHWGCAKPCKYVRRPSIFMISNSCTRTHNAENNCYRSDVLHLFNDSTLAKEEDNHDCTCDVLQLSLVAPSLRIQKTISVVGISFKLQWLHPRSGDRTS